MFKYTADPDVRRKYHSIARNARRPWDDHFHLAVSICGSSAAYFQVGNFWRHYLAFQFYSPTKLRQVPLNGTLISVDWFMETAV